MRRAVELGVNFIDTADSYGPGISEAIIAEALYPYPEGVVVATKGGLERPGPDQWVENGRPEHLKSACEGSLRRLRLDRIDLYQLHRIDAKVPMTRFWRRRLRNSDGVDCGCDVERRYGATVILMAVEPLLAIRVLRHRVGMKVW